MAARLEAALAIGEGYEDRLDRARIFARERLFVIGARLIAGDLAPLDVGEAISALAGACVERAAPPRQRRARPRARAAARRARRGPRAWASSAGAR